MDEFMAAVRETGCEPVSLAIKTTKETGYYTLLLLLKLENFL